MLDDRLVRVAGDDDLDSGGNWIYVEFRKIVNHVDENPADFDQFRFRQRASPCARIFVTAHYRDRRNARQFFNDLGVADIAGVNDEITAAQEVNRLGPKKVMRIRNKAYTNRSAQVPSNAPGAATSNEVVFL